MPANPIDWPAIRAKYEQGIKQASLAREYGITQQAISKRALKESWVVHFVVPPTTDYNTPQPPEHDPQDILSIIGTLLQKVAVHAQATELEPKDIKLLADAISQFHKVKLTSTQDKPTASGIASDVLPYLDMAQLDRLAALQAEQETILDEARAKKLEAEQGIMSINKHNRKIG